ncbi:MAG: hypothetical protein WC005_03595 [Candidatus Nanopelagicales bacterium]
MQADEYLEFTRRNEALTTALRARRAQAEQLLPLVEFKASLQVWRLPDGTRVEVPFVDIRNALAAPRASVELLIDALEFGEQALLDYDTSQERLG